MPLGWPRLGAKRTASRKEAEGTAPRAAADSADEHELLSPDGKGSSFGAEAYDRTTLARTIDKLLRERYAAEDVRNLQRETFRSVVRWLGSSILLEDQVEHAVVAKIAQLDTCMVIILSILTLGLYIFFRPMKDLALLVLTKKGRVILVKREHYSIWGANPALNGWVLVRCLLLLLVASTTPFVVVFYFWSHGIHGTLAMVIVEHPELQALRDNTKRKMQTFYAFIGACWLALLAFVWVNRQRGYGSRHRRGFKASNIAAAQYVLSDSGMLGCCHRLRGLWCCCCLFCCHRRRRGTLRLFFGTYPTAGELNQGLSFWAPRAQGAEPQLSMGSDSAGAEQSGARQQPADLEGMEQRAARFFPCISVLLLISSILTQCFTFQSYYEELLSVKEAYSFCAAATSTANCTKSACKHFGVDHSFRRMKFCSYVSWVEDDEALCGFYRHGASIKSCCGSCVAGEVLDYLGNDDIKAWMQALHSCLNYLTLAFAFLASGFAMRYAFAQDSETSRLEVEFVQDCFQPAPEPFEMHCNLAEHFLELVFRTRRRADEEAMTNRQQAATGRGQPYTNRLPVAPTPPNIDIVDSTCWQAFFEDGYRIVDVRCSREGHLVEDVVRVPTRCLGFMRDERVVRAWTETPLLTYADLWYAAIASAAFALLTVYWPEQLGGPFVKTAQGSCRATLQQAQQDTSLSEALSSREQAALGALWCMAGRPVLLVALAAAVLPVLLLVRYILFCSGQQCVVIITDQRIFTVNHRPGLLGLLPARLCSPGIGLGLRVEAFQHGSELFYGRMKSRVPPWFLRLLCKVNWRAGEVVLQSRHGVIKLDRNYGDADEVYDVAATYLTMDIGDFHLKDQYKGVELPMLFGVEKGSLITFEPAKDEAVRTVSHLTWVSAVPPDKDPNKEVSIAKATEDPIFVWSFMETGDMFSPFSKFNDLVVTTDRIRLASQVALKEFDCRTCLCWGMCWCAALRRLCCQEHLQATKSFLNFSHLSAFSTETSILPTCWPLECPCYNVLCAMLTSCFCLSPRTCPPLKDCRRWPSTAVPLTQLWVKWMQRNGKSVQPDLVLSVRPYALDEFVGEPAEGKERDVEASLDEETLREDDRGRCCCSQKTSRPPRDAEEVQKLRALMQIVLLKGEEQIARWAMDNSAEHVF